jgi:radical SAM protein with 4Fe4S-binding SPASM domain
MILGQHKKNKIKKSTYSELLPFSFKSKLDALFKIKRNHKLDLPRQYWIEITNKCNLSCIMCPVSKGLPRPQSMMTFEQFRSIIDQIYENRPSIMLHVAGEPLLHKDVFKMIDYSKEKGCWVGMHTNATLLNEQVANALLDGCLDQISFSFDGYDAETYQKIRKGADFQKVRDQIEQFLVLKKKKKLKRPFTRIEIILLSETKDKIKDFVNYWSLKDVDRVSIKPGGDWLGAVDIIPVYKSKNWGPRHCRDILNKCAILVDGTVVPCCRDILGRMPMGNVFKQSLKQIWNNPAYIQLRFELFTNTVKRKSMCYNCNFRHCWSIKEKIQEWILKQFFWRNLKKQKYASSS